MFKIFFISALLHTILCQRGAGKQTKVVDFEKNEITKKNSKNSKQKHF